VPIQAISYTSTASPELGLDAVDQLARSAAAFNVQAGVTGVLLFDGCRFLQYLEGPRDGMAVVFARVQNSRSHFDLAELGRGFPGRRFFPYWSMQLLPAEPLDIYDVADADWSRLVLRRARDEGEPESGVERLARLTVPNWVDRPLAP
jgi:hypothetical protein